MDGKALEALHAAAKAVGQTDGVSDVSVDNDHRDGEILFHVGSVEYQLKLTAVWAPAPGGAS